MSFLVVVDTFLQLIGVHAATFLFNHLINIPLSLLLGFGKYVAFGIAVTIDIVQMFIYFNILNNTRTGRRLGWAINKKLFNSYKQPPLIAKFHRGWIYFGIALLSLLPIYFGGMFAAVFTAHLMRLDRFKSYLFIFLGSLIGCYIWTVGVWSAVALLIRFVRPSIA